MVEIKELKETYLPSGDLVACPTCQRSDEVVKHGLKTTRFGKVQRYLCKSCGRIFRAKPKEIPEHNRRDHLYIQKLAYYGCVHGKDWDNSISLDEVIQQRLVSLAKRQKKFACLHGRVYFLAERFFAKVLLSEEYDFERVLQKWVIGSDKGVGQSFYLIKAKTRTGKEFFILTDGVWGYMGSGSRDTALLELWLENHDFEFDVREDFRQLINTMLYPTSDYSKYTQELP